VIASEIGPNGRPTPLLEIARACATCGVLSFPLYRAGLISAVGGVCLDCAVEGRRQGRAASPRSRSAGTWRAVLPTSRCKTCGYSSAARRSADRRRRLNRHIRANPGHEEDR
jgi:hypothetical protein